MEWIVNHDVIEIPDTQDSPDLSDQLRKSIEFLDENYKECIVLRYFENFTVEEIASILDCPAGTVKSRLFSARKKLAELLIEQSQLKN
jgi:RNA polymerase sigma-70 factor (ECF subfamily)